MASWTDDAKLPERENPLNPQGRGVSARLAVNADGSRSGSFPHPYDRLRDRVWDRDDLADRLEDEQRAVDGWRAAPSSGSGLEGYW